jgi:hypothetical protein
VHRSKVKGVLFCISCVQRRLLIYNGRLIYILRVRRRKPQLRKLLVCLGLIASFTNCLHASEDMGPLTIEMPDPNIRITIPGMPKIDMSVHPMNEHKPYFRLRGSSGTTSVSIITQKIDVAVTPMSCATAIANVILSLPNVNRDQLFLGRADEQTFLIIYGVPMEKSVLLNTHIVSSDEAIQCIEAHVSKISTSDADIEPWFNGFGESKIEKL